MRRALRSFGQAGFTPIETLLATAIGLIAIASFISFNTAQMYAMRGQTNQVDLQTSARSIADLFAREVRRAGTGTNVACTGAVSTGLLVAQSSQVRIRADLDANGVLTGQNEDVTYTLDFNNNQVTRTDNNGSGTGLPRTDTLWSGVSISGSQMTYFDSAGNQLATGSSGLSAADLLTVRRIKLELALTGKVVQPGNTIQLTATDAASIELRNRHFVTDVCAFN